MEDEKIDTMQQLGMDNKVNLCDSCTNDYPDCDAKNIILGNGVGNDNTAACAGYKPDNVLSDRCSRIIERSILEPNDIHWHNAFGYVTNWNGESGEPVTPSDVRKYIDKNIEQSANMESIKLIKLKEGEKLFITVTSKNDLSMAKMHRLYERTTEMLSDFVGKDNLRVLVTDDNIEVSATKIEFENKDSMPQKPSDTIFENHQKAEEFAKKNIQPKSIQELTKESQVMIDKYVEQGLIERPEDLKKELSGRVEDSKPLELTREMLDGLDNVYYQLLHAYGENSNFDYMKSYLRIIDKLKAGADVSFLPIDSLKLLCFIYNRMTSFHNENYQNSYLVQLLKFIELVSQSKDVNSRGAFTVNKPTNQKVGELGAPITGELDNFGRPINNNDDIRMVRNGKAIGITSGEMKAMQDFLHYLTDSGSESVSSNQIIHFTNILHNIHYTNLEDMECLNLIYKGLKEESFSIDCQNMIRFRYAIDKLYYILKNESEEIIDEAFEATEQAGTEDEGITDKEIDSLCNIYNRMKSIHEENENTEYMELLYQVITNLCENENAELSAQEIDNLFHIKSILLSVHDEKSDAHYMIDFDSVLKKIKGSKG